MRNGINVIEYFKPGEEMRMMHYSVNDTGIVVVGQNESRLK